MNREIEKTLKGFQSLSEFREFLEEVADGAEVSRGMDPTDKSKQKKKEETDASADSAEVAPEPIVIDPVQAPGSQVSLGNKNIPKDVDEPKTTEIKISGKKDKVDMKPTAMVDVNSASR